MHGEDAGQLARTHENGILGVAAVPNLLQKNLHVVRRRNGPARLQYRQLEKLACGNVHITIGIPFELAGTLLWNLEGRHFMRSGHDFDFDNVVQRFRGHLHDDG